jgi:hypothetical protein
MSYLTKKPGSLEEVISQKTKLESGYQDKFKKELEKAGKGIGAMTPAEKSAFFKKIDKMHNAKNEEMSKDSAYAIGMAQAKKSKGDEPPLEKSTITKGHEIAKSILKKESLEKSIRNMWQQSADGIEEMKKSAKYLKAQDVAPEEPVEKDKKEGYESMVPNKKDDESDKKRKTTMTGEKPSDVEMEPKINYNK